MLEAHFTKCDCGSFPVEIQQPGVMLEKVNMLWDLNYKLFRKAAKFRQ